MPNSTLITQEIIVSAIQAESTSNPFVIDLDECRVWEVAGYSERRNFVRYLLASSGCVEDKHFNVRRLTGESKTYVFTLTGFKFALARANTQQGDDYLEYLIGVEQTYIQQLERQLERFHSTPIAPAAASSSADLSSLYQQLADVHAENEHLKEENNALRGARTGELEIAQRKVFLPNKEDFNIPAQTANDIIGYAKLEYLLTVLKAEFTKDVDWTRNNLGEFFMTEACFHELVIVARPKRGALVSKLPEILLVERDRMYRGVQVTPNRRFGSSHG